MHTAQANRSSVRPTDNDGDGLLDEDPNEDLDADGVIYTLRWRARDDEKDRASLVLDERDPETGEPSPYVRVRANLEALIDRKSFYRLVELGAHHDGWFGLWSSGTFFPVILSDELP